MIYDPLVRPCRASPACVAAHDFSRFPAGAPSCSSIEAEWKGCSKRVLPLQPAGFPLSACPRPPVSLFPFLLIRYVISPTNICFGCAWGLAASLQLLYCPSRGRVCFSLTRGLLCVYLYVCLLCFLVLSPCRCPRLPNAVSGSFLNHLEAFSSQWPCAPACLIVRMHISVFMCPLPQEDAGEGAGAASNLRSRPLADLARTCLCR